VAEEKIREAAKKDMVRVKRVSSKVKTWYLWPQQKGHSYKIPI